MIDVPPEATAALGGLKQLRVRGLLNGVEFTSNTMPAGGGVLALSVSRKLMKAAALEIGQEATVEIERERGAGEIAVPRIQPEDPDRTSGAG